MAESVGAFTQSLCPSFGVGEAVDFAGMVVVGQAPEVHYRFERLLGEGAQASVWLATRVGSSAGPVVLKVLHPRLLLSDPELSHLVFRKELVALSRLSERVPPTPFVVRLLDHGEVALRGIGVPWLALEYVPGGALGGNLAARVQEAIQSTAVAFEPERARRLLGCLVAGLSALHELGVIHRDVKPSNVLMCGVGDNELGKVADLGAARPVGMKTTFNAGVRLGEPGYAAPEQQHDTRLGPWSDVFSLAAVTHFVLTGEPMFGGSRPVALARAFRGDMEPLASRARLHPGFRTATVLAGIEAVLRRATTRSVAERIPSVRAFWAELTPWLTRAVEAGPARASHVVCKATLESAQREPWTFQSAPAAEGSPNARACAFDPDGHGLALSDAGLLYWHGTRWIPMAAPSGLRAPALRDVVRLAPDRWLAVGECGEVAYFNPTHCELACHLGPGGPRLRKLRLLGGGAFMALGSRGNQSWLYAFDGQRWLAPAPIPSLHLQDVCRIDAQTALVSAVHENGQGAIWHVRLGERPSLRTLLPAPCPAMTTTVAGAAAVCASGEVVFLDPDGGLLETEKVGAEGPLTAIVEDGARVLWVAARSGLLRRERAGAWNAIYPTPDRSSPIITLYIASGLLLALASNGTVITGHQTP